MLGQSTLALIAPIILLVIGQSEAASLTTLVTHTRWSNTSYTYHAPIPQSRTFTVSLTTSSPVSTTTEASPPTVDLGLGAQDDITSGTCSEEGNWNCIDGSFFQRCASGRWSFRTAVAPGTHCVIGHSAELHIFKRDDFSTQVISPSDQFVGDQRLARRCGRMDNLINDDVVKDAVGDILRDVLEGAGADIDDLRGHGGQHNP